MIDESMDKEQMAKPPQAWEFRSKPAWQRMIVMLGGVTVNLVLGFFIYSMILFVYGERELPNANVKDGVWVTNDYGRELGFKTGDKVVSMNGKVPVDWLEMKEELIYSKEVIVDRGGQQVTISLPDDMIGEMSSGDDQGSYLALRFPFVVSAIPDTSHNFGILEKGDQVMSIGGKPVAYFDQAKAALAESKGQTVKTVVRRGEEMVTLETPVSDKGLFGVSPGGMGYKELDKYGVYEFNRKSYGFFESFPAGWQMTKDKLASYVRGFKLLFKSGSGAHKGLGGFGALGGLMPSEWGQWEQFWSITAFLSIILAFMNLLPIPLLDGGHVMFLLYEMVSGREPNQKLQEALQLIGLVLLLLLMVYANGNDIARYMNWR